MLLTITKHKYPATDLGFLLHKHPARLVSFEMPFGKAHVFYPEASDDRVFAVLALESEPVDPRL
jgi:hypothetical protein